MYHFLIFIERSLFSAYIGFCMVSAKFRLKINYKISILGIHEIRSVTLCLSNGTAFNRSDDYLRNDFNHIVMFCLLVSLSLSFFFPPIFQSKRFPSVESCERHRERIVGWVGKYSILSIQFSRKMTRPPSRLLLFQPNIIAGTRTSTWGGFEGKE